MTVTVTGGTISPREQETYVARARRKYPHDRLDALEIRVDGDYVDLTYTLRPQPFSRIRRITGYLVGDMTRWNDAKTAEEAARVKHA